MNYQIQTRQVHGHEMYRVIGPGYCGQWHPDFILAIEEKRNLTIRLIPDEPDAHPWQFVGACLLIVLTILTAAACVSAWLAHIQPTSTYP